MIMEIIYNIVATVIWALLMAYIVIWLFIKIKNLLKKK